jgi:histidine-containing phosphotransfer protein
MERELSEYKKIGIHLNQFMGSSSSIGAKRVRNVCVAFRAASEQNNRAGWVRYFPLLYTRASITFSPATPLLSLSLSLSEK